MAQAGADTNSLPGPGGARACGRAAGLAVCLAATIIVVALVWAVYRPIGDMYVGLAGGRDVLAGKLGEPDDWAFTTDGRIWLNQNWGTHLLYYASYLAGGEAGLLVLKMVLLGAMAAFIVLAARARGASATAALLATAIVVLASQGYIDLRPNLTTLALTPLLLWLLYCAEQRVHLVWPVAVVIGVWANMHGGFLFALGVFGLWVACRLIPMMIARGPGAALRRGWPLLGGLVLAVGLAAVGNPFGLRNVTHPFTVAADSAWRNVDEWKPIFMPRPPRFGSTREFFMVLGLLIGMWTLRLLIDLPLRRRPATIRHIATGLFCLIVAIVSIVSVTGVLLGDEAPDERIAMEFHLVLLGASAVAVASGTVLVRGLLRAILGRQKVRGDSAEDVGRIVFDVGLLAVVTAMAVSARRFIPLAMVVAAPGIGRGLTWLLDARRRTWPGLLAAGAVLLVSAPLAVALWRHYDPNNPLRPKATLLERMVCVQNFPLRATEFLNANGIEGRVFNEWRWEGYLHWKCPQLKLLIGGRAQQVYDPKTMAGWKRIIVSPSAPQLLGRMDVHLVVIPAGSSRYAGLYDRLLGSGWAIVYSSRREIILADADAPATARLIELAGAGQLAYPDSAIGSISRAMCLGSPATAAPASKVAEAYLEAIDSSPNAPAYMALTRMVRLGEIDRQWLIPYMRRQFERLEAMDFHRPDGMEILECRREVAGSLSQLYRAEGAASEAAEWASLAGRIMRQIREARDRWR